MKKNGRTLLAAACCLMLILSAGCAALTPVKEEPLEERVKNYMQAQIERKWDRAYAFFDSSSREKVERDSYVYRVRQTSVKAFTIAEITVLPSGNQATVKVKLDIPYMGFNFKGISDMQNWVKEGGQWFVKSEFQFQSQRTPFGPSIPQEKRK